MKYAANKKRYVTLKKRNKCTKINIRTAGKWRVRDEMSDNGSSSERQVGGSKAGGSPVSTSWVTEPDLPHLEPITQILTTSWSTLADFLMILASNTSLLLLWSLSVSYEILYSDALYKSLSHSLFIQIGPRRTAVYVIINDKKSFHCTYT